jgi:hypothetical protein
MKRVTYPWLWVMTLAGASYLFAGSLCAQPLAGSGVSAVSNIVLALPPQLPLVATGGKSPVDFFRELLAVNPLERIRLIAARPPAIQRQILAKVREYQALSPEQRELRLQVTELRYYLWPLMGLDPTNRAPRLAAIPPEMRKLVEDRLAEWDQLPADLQKELRDNEAAVRYFTELATSTPEQQAQMRSSISPARREMLDRGIGQWQALPEKQRDKLVNRFNQFFELTHEEQQKALSTLSEPERRQIEKTLDKYSHFSPLQRAQCIRSCQILASLTLEERQAFLKNAEQWKIMSPTERQAWRDLVTKLSLQRASPFGRRQPNVPDFRRLLHRPPIVATNAGSPI